MGVHLAEMLVKYLKHRSHRATRSVPTFRKWMAMQMQTRGRARPSSSNNNNNNNNNNQQSSSTSTSTTEEEEVVEEVEEEVEEDESDDVVAGSVESCHDPDDDLYEDGECMVGPP